MALWRIALFSATLCALNCSRAEAKEKPPWQPRGVLATVKIPTDGEPIRVPVALDAREYYFVVDFGSTCTVLSQPGKEWRNGPDNSLRIDFPVNRFSFAGIESPWIKHVAALDLEHLKSDGAVQIDGILGVDALAKFVVHLDFDHGQMLIVEPNGADRPPGMETALTLDRFGRPNAWLRIGKSRADNFLIDTGLLSGIQINSSHFAACRLDPDAADTGVRIFTKAIVAQQVEHDQIRIPHCALGCFQVKNVAVARSDENVLSLAYLARYRLTLDMGRRKSYWEPSARFALLDRGDHCGIDYELDSKSAWNITYVNPSGLAAAAGLQVGDRITSVNGFRATTSDRHRWTRILGWPQREPVELTVQRETERLTLNIVEPTNE